MAATARTPPSGASSEPPAGALHVPVLLRPLVAALSPVSGTWLDGTFGAGGHARALLEAGADRVIGLDRDPDVFDLARGWAGAYGDRLQLVRSSFARLDEHARGLDGVLLDLGVSSMQLDRAERGFSFMRDGPLDMRMSRSGPSAADLVNAADEADLAGIFRHYGEERAARRIARLIVERRKVERIETTGQLVRLVEKCLPRRAGRHHPATRVFQALRIAVNDELGELVKGLEAAERALAPGGRLAVISFHSLEDRIVKRFLRQRASTGGGGSRHAPAAAGRVPAFRLLGPAIAPDPAELAANPRARSARLRLAERTAAPPAPADRAALGLPSFGRERGGERDGGGKRR